MFGGKSSKANTMTKGTTLLAPSIQITGDLKFDGHLEVEGKVTGNIYAEDSTDARVRILEKGRVEGEVRAPNVVINGHVTGDVYATKHLELAANAVVNGNVHYQVIEMVKGAQVNGNLMHVEESPMAGKSKRKPETPAAPAAAPAPEAETKANR